MLYSLYKDAYISQLARVLEPALSGRTSSKQIKRAGRLRGCRKNKMHNFANGSYQAKWKTIISFCKGLNRPIHSKLQTVRTEESPLWSPQKRGWRPLGWNNFPDLKALLLWTQERSMCDRQGWPQCHCRKLGAWTFLSAWMVPSNKLPRAGS